MVPNLVRVIIENIVGERETLNPFHGKEQPGKTPTPPPPSFMRINVVVVLIHVPSEAPFERFEAGICEASGLEMESEAGVE
jgi:hypothetical protein